MPREEGRRAERVRTYILAEPCGEGDGVDGALVTGECGHEAVGKSH